MHTGLDCSIPHIGVLMEKFGTSEYPRHALPPGYSFVRYRPSFGAQWAALHYEVGQFDSLEEAEATFERDFAGRPALADRMLFVMDEGNRLAGTGCLWDGAHFGVTRQRLHHISVSPLHQGKGIAKAIVSKLLDIYNELGVENYIYLTSQTWSWRALHLYMGFGFRPYMGEKPENWRAVNLTSGKFEPWDFAEKNIEAWRMIYGKISGYSSGMSCLDARVTRPRSVLVFTQPMDL
ncbi:MAG: GNAT family N-acetyltransferase [Firmicutes bacterium]|nr:GNAT family N-acetyltransferase [Bacillota bacterium]